MLLISLSTHADAPARSKPYQASAGENRYVSDSGSDDNPGTQQAPFKTILRASQDATPGTTILVAPGIYDGGFKTTASGTAAAPIRYVSVKKWAARIVPPSFSKNIGAWENSGDHVQIDGFEIDGTDIQGGKNWWIGIGTSGSHTRIVNNHVHHIANKDSDCKPNGGAGIGTNGYYRGSNHTIERNVVHHIGPVTYCHTIHGIYIGAPIASVKNNLIYRIADGGVHLWHDANRVEIVNNTIFNTEYGIIVGGAQPYHTSGVNDHTHVANNIVFDCLYGIFEMGRTGPNNTYSNNLVMKIKITPWALHVPHKDPIVADPRFVNYLPEGGGDYRLQRNSPARGKGSATYAPPIDLNGATRKGKSKIDVGAFQY